jgi:hypothetical protein
MRRIAIALTLLALIAGLYACSSDAPTAPKGGGGTGPGPSALQIRLFTNDANPKAGTCTLIQADVTLNGNPVADGTGVSFSTTFGAFAQNALNLISVVTENGSAVTAICSDFTGLATVRAQANVSGQAGSATILISFQPDAASGPFVASCNPSFGAPEGGTILTLTGGRFFGNAASTRVRFTAGGITREGLVTSVTTTAITVSTPAFPELTAPSTPAQISLTLGLGSASAVTLTLPNCFAIGSQDATTPRITAVLPSSGTNEGNTRVSIIGSGFAAPVQVFFGNVEAEVVSVFFNQVVVLTPPAFGAGQDNLNQQVDVRVRNVTSGREDTLAGGFRYVTPIQLTAFSGANLQRVDQPFTALTLHGQGFQAPVAVSLAGVVAQVISVSATELVVRPGFPFLVGCSDISGDITVTNINTGDTTSGLSFTYLVAITKPVITGISPTSGHVPVVVTSATITGLSLPRTIADADVKFGTRQATVTSASSDGTSLTVLIPVSEAAAPACPTGTAAGTLLTSETVDVTVTVRSTTCSDTFAQGFRYLQPCTVPPTPTPAPTPTPTP